MKNRALFLAVLATLAVFASDAVAQDPKVVKQRAAKMKKYPNLKHCDSPSCTVTVTVTGTPCDGTKIQADPPDLGVDRNQKDVPILWSLATPGYTFDPKKGIVFKDAKQKQFKCKPGKKNTEYECVDKNGDAVDYKYGITLLDSNKKACHTDPIIVNGF
jgi:hypothetical protein